MTNKPFGTLYTGLTNDIERRVMEHVLKINPESFSAKYGLDQLVYLEEFDDLEETMVRENRIKSWKRQWKINLILKNNYYWENLAKEYVQETLKTLDG